MSFSRPTLTEGSGSSVGTGNFVVTDITGTQSFSLIPNGNTVRYIIQDNPADVNREWGLGTKTTVAGSPVIQRTDSGVIGGTNGAGARVNFTANKQVIYVAPLGEVDDTPNVTADPIAAVSTLGQRVYRTDTNQLRVYAGSTPTWVNILRSDGGGIITNSADQIGFTIQGFANQINPIVRIGSSTNANQVRIWDAAGNNVAVTVNPTGDMGGIQVRGNSTGTSHPVAEFIAGSGLTAAIFQVTGFGGSAIFRANDTGGGIASLCNSQGVNQICFVAQMFTGQVVDAFQIQDHLGNQLFHITPTLESMWGGLDSGSTVRNEFIITPGFQNNNTSAWTGNATLTCPDFNNADGTSRVVMYLYSDGTSPRATHTAPSSAPTDSDISNSQIAFYLDEGGNNLKVRVRYSNGTYKTATVAVA